MKQGVLLNTRTRLLLNGRTGNYHPQRHGCRKRKSVRGCIAGPDISVMNVIIVKRGPADLAKLTDKDSDRPSTRGPKRANHIRKVWGLKKTDDVRQYVVRRKIEGKNGKKDKFKSPKIQRLITPQSRHHKARRLVLKKRRHEKNVKEAGDYSQLLAGLRDAKRSALLSKKREAKSEKASDKTKAVAKPAATKTVAKPAGAKPTTKAPVAKAPVAPKATTKKPAATKPAAPKTVKK